ncbi:MAG: tetratricopeptide repeat protein [Phycisphaerales bacterium]
MKLKPKTSRRLMILGGVTLGVVGGITTLFLVRNAGKASKVASNRALGLQMVAQGNYYPALGYLANAIESNKDMNDREALIAYGYAREAIEEPDSGHIREAITIFQRVWSLDHSDRKIGLHLIDLCNSMGMYPEAKDIASRLRTGDIAKVPLEDFELLRQEGNARIGANPTDPEITPILRRLLELKPDDFPTQVVLVEHLRDRGKGNEANEFVASLGTGDTPERKAQIELVTALAKRDMPGYNASDKIFDALCEIAGIDPMTAGPTRDAKLSALETLRAAALFDSVGAFQHTLAVLSAGVKNTKDPVVLRVLARRSWMSGRPGDTLALIPEVDLGPSGTPSEVLVYRALSFADMGKHAEKQTIVDALAKREGDYRAKAWAMAFKVVATEKETPPSDVVPVLHEALKVAKNDPVLLTYQGENLQRLGRFAEARQAWETACASSMSVGWLRPWLNRANLALAQGKPITALEAAEAATRIAPRSMATFATYFRAQVTLLENGYANAEKPDALLKLADRIDAELALNPNQAEIKPFRELMVTGRVLLAGLTGGQSGAKEMWEKTQKDLGPFSNDTYAQLAQTSLKRNLGLGSAVLAAWEKTEGLTPRIGLARAFEMRAANNDAGAQAMLREQAGMKRADSERMMALGWRQALAQYLGAIDDPKAKDAWTESADFAPDNLDAQYAAVQAPSVATDLALVNRLLERIAAASKFTPDSLPPQLRLAKARALLAEPLTPANRTESVALLRQLIGQERDLVDAQILLVRALMMDRPDVGVKPLRSEAIAAINGLLPYVPDQDNWTLEQAKLYKGEGDLTNAVAMFTRIAESDTSPVALKILAVEEMASVREYDAASRVLEKLRSTVPAESRPPVDLKLAEMYRAMKKDRSARDMYRSIDVASLSRAEYVIALAEGLHGYGDVDAAKTAIARLDALDVTPDGKLIGKARFFARTNRPSEAEAALREAVTKFPDSSEAWTSLASLLVEQGKMDDARAVVAQAKGKLPKDTRIASLDRQLAVLADSGLTGNTSLDDMVKILEQNPATAARAEGVKAISAAQKAGQLKSTERVNELKARFKADPSLLAVLARTLTNEKPPQMNLAAGVLNEAMQNHPASAEIAILGTNMFRQMGDLNTALRYATAWQELDSQPLADMIVAEIKLSMNQPEGVAQMLEPLVLNAKLAPENPSNVRMMTLYGQALILNGKTDQASQELGGLLQASSGLRTQFWLGSAGSLITPDSKVRAWIDRVKPMIDGTREEEELALAGAYANAAARFPSLATEYNSEAEKTLRKLTTRADASARAWEALGSLMQSRNSPDTVMAYNQALTKDSKSVFALRGLASVEKDSAKAMDYAKRAYEITGPNDAISQLLYGQTLVVNGRSLSGAPQQQAYAQAENLLANHVAVVPNDVQGRLFLIEALEGQGKLEKTFDQYEALVNNTSLTGINRAGVLNNYAYAIVRAGKGNLELERAKAMVEQATQIQPESAFYDTLGSVERARRKRDLAIAAYRKAIQIDSTAYGSILSLAEVLRDGTPTPAEVEEAKTLIKRLREAGQAVPAEVRERLASVRDQ